MINFNGKLYSDHQEILTANNRGYAYADALFETIRVVNGKIMFWEDHYFRLMSSMRILRMEIPMNFSPEFLENEIMQLLQANDLTSQTARVKINIHRNTGGFYRPETRDISYIIQTKALDQAFFTLDTNQPHEVELYKDHYVYSGLLSTLKTTSKLPNILASIYAEENAYDNCLLVNEKKSVIEAVNGNLFLVKGNVIKTPPLAEGCLNGIIRKKLIEIIKSIDDFELEEKAISPFELQKADELFLTNAIVGIQPISKYRKKEYAHAVAQNLVGKLNAKARLD